MLRQCLLVSRLASTEAVDAFKSIKVELLEQTTADESACTRDKQGVGHNQRNLFIDGERGQF